MSVNEKIRKEATYVINSLSKLHQKLSMQTRRRLFPTSVLYICDVWRNLGNKFIT